MTNTVTECCPRCGREITITWSIEENGYKAFCPYCGGRLMLCSECAYPHDNCDYSTSSDTCKHNPSKCSYAGHNILKTIGCDSCSNGIELVKMLGEIDILLEKSTDRSPAVVHVYSDGIIIGARYDDERTGESIHHGMIAIKGHPTFINESLCKIIGFTE